MGSKKRKKMKKVQGTSVPVRKSQNASKRENGQLIFSEYTITFDPIEDKTYKKLPAKVQDSMEKLHDKLLSAPEETISELTGLLKKYPHVPMLYNYLSAAYSRMGENLKAEDVVLENYRRHPDYIFARVNYAQICLQKGDYEKIAEIFDHTFDLARLYPNRSTFHVTEVTAFMGIIGVYFALIGEMNSAKLCYRLLKQLDPTAPVTRQLRYTLHPPLMLRILAKLSGQDARKLMFTKLQPQHTRK